MGVSKLLHSVNDVSNNGRDADRFSKLRIILYYMAKYNSPKKWCKKSTFEVLKEAGIEVDQFGFVRNTFSQPRKRLARTVLPVGNSASDSTLGKRNRAADVNHESKGKHTPRHKQT